MYIVKNELEFWKTVNFEYLQNKNHDTDIPPYSQLNPPPSPPIRNISNKFFLLIIEISYFLAIVDTSDLCLI